MSSLDLAGPPPVARRPRPRAAAWLALGRVSNAPTVVSNVLAGAAIAVASPDPATVGAVAVALVLFYVAGMVLNDLLDLEGDRRRRPERPLVTGEVSPRAAVAATAGLFAAGSGLLLAVGVAPFLAGLGLIALIALYDAWHKGNPLSPVLMAGTRVLVYVVAFLALAGTAWGELALAAALLGIYVVGLTQIAKTAAGVPWPPAAVLAPVAVYAALADSALAVLALAAFAAWSARALWALLRRGGGVGDAVHRLIAGISLLDAAVLAAVGAPAGAVAIAVAAFALTVALQRRIAGT
jgi:4-hydroxybenzoate polyprenyltransferase